MEDLIRNFHNLGGSKISEHKRNFNAYKLKLLSSKICTNTLVSKLNPKTRQEEIFKIKLLQQQNMHDELYEILKTGDKVNSNVVLKNLDFLIVFNEVNGVDFVEKHCKELSYVNRVKVINRLALRIGDCLKGKDYFENVKRKYGLKMATPFLHACEEEYIHEIVIKYDLKLNQTLIIRLHKKYPKFLHFYYAFKKDSKFENHTKVGRYVANYDLQVYHSLLPYGVPTLGKRNLKMFLLRYKSEVVKYPNLLAKKNKVVLQNLSKDDFLVYFQHKLPKSVDCFNPDEVFLRFLKALPKTQRGSTLFTCFKTKYGFDLFEELNLINSDLLQLLSHEDRLRFDLKNYPEMLPICDSLPKLEGLFLSNKNPLKKIELGNKLLKTCDINGDNAALLRVLKFFQQHFNPPANECLQSLGGMKLEVLSEEHWEYINELRLNFEVNNKNSWLGDDPLNKFILYQILNGKTCSDNDIKTHYNRTNNYFSHSDCIKKYPQQYKQYLIKLSEALPRIFEGEELMIAMNNVFTNIITFNKENPKLIIHHDTYLGHLKKICESAEEDTKFVHLLYYVTDNSSVLLAKNAHAIEYKEILDGFAKVAHKAYSDKLYLWLLKHRPDLLEKYSGLFFEAENFTANLYYEVSNMDFSNLHKVLKDEALKRLVDGKYGKDVVCSIKLLSFEKDVDLQNLVLKYLPDTECEIDPTKPDFTDLLNVQRAIISTLKNASPPSNNLNRILYFCKRDYLKYALDPLYYSICYSPENSIQETLEELLSRAVSVRKHTMHLITVVGTTENKFNVLKKFVEEETNKSLKCFAFRKLVRCFFEDREERWFELFKQNIALLNVDDWMTIEVVCLFKNVPRMFYSRYAEVVWRQLEGENNEPLRIVNSLGEVDSDVAEMIIKKSLINKKHNYVEEVHEFTTNYFLNNNHASFECVKPQQVDTLAQRMEMMQSTFKFLEFLCGYFLKEIGKDAERKVEVLNKLGGIFVDFEFKLLINFAKLFLINAKLICGDDFDEEMRVVNEDFIASLKEEYKERESKASSSFKNIKTSHKKVFINRSECEGQASDQKSTKQKDGTLENMDYKEGTNKDNSYKKAKIAGVENSIIVEGARVTKDVAKEFVTKSAVEELVTKSDAEELVTKRIAENSVTKSDAEELVTKRIAEDLATKSLTEEQMMEIDVEAKTVPTQKINTYFLELLKNFLLIQEELNLKMYGADIIPIFGELSQRYLEKFFNVISGNAFEMFLDLIEELLQANSETDSTNILVFCIFLLPKQKTNVLRFKTRRRKIIKKFKRIDSEVVGIYLDWFLENCEKSGI